MITSDSPIMDIFRDYANPKDSSRLTLVGVEKLFSMIGINVEVDIIVLYLAYLMECKCMYIITRSELHRLTERTTWNGFNGTVTTFNDLRERIPQLRIELDNRDLYRNVYDYSFMYAVRAQQDSLRKRLHLSTAIEMLHIFFNYPLLPSFIMYLKRVRSEDEGIRMDEWKMTFLFFESYGSSVTGFDPQQAWPLLLCDFVSQLSFVSKKHNIQL